MTSPPLMIAVVQCPLDAGRAENVARIEHWIRDAAAKDASVILTPELFEGPYFPQTMDEAERGRATRLEGHPTLARMSALARELSVTLPISVYEEADDGRYNSLVVIDADGSDLGIYRKAHIPDGPGYEEKFYFSPGNTGFRTWQTASGCLGVGVCWDQWFPESARAMRLLGADILLYPTAIGTEPATPGEDSREPWRRVMIGHAVANATPLAAANRVGFEGDLQFYGSSFICDHRGELLADMGRNDEGVAIAEIDRDAIARYRRNWDFLSDRRPKLYRGLVDDDAVE
ncbi:MAG: carbon-nitrogen hydrolase [Polyangiales bacterium]